MLCCCTGQRATTAIYPGLGFIAAGMVRRRPPSLPAPSIPSTNVPLPTPSAPQTTARRCTSLPSTTRPGSRCLRSCTSACWRPAPTGEALADGATLWAVHRLHRRWCGAACKCTRAHGRRWHGALPGLGPPTLMLRPRALPPLLSQVWLHDAAPDPLCQRGPGAARALHARQGAALRLAVGLGGAD